MFHNKPLRTIVAIWFAWAVIMVGFQALVQARFEPQRPDRALPWTTYYALDPGERPYLFDPFMNNHVEWDSEYYISIATVGYDDPQVPAIPPTFDWATAPDATCSDEEIRTRACISLNYAFFPFYPLVMRLVAFPLQLLGLEPVAAATLAGVVVSLLGTLFAMLALYDLAAPHLDEAGGIRAALYLVIFPTGMFLAQVYTEGLFLGLAFGSLALLQRKRWVWAAVLAALAVWTRAVGVALVVPLALAWFKEVDWKHLSLRPFPWRTLGKAALVLLPPLNFLVWKVSPLGVANGIVQERFFGRGLLLFAQSWGAWQGAIASLGDESTATTAYYLIEFACIAIALAACIFTLRRYPGPALFGLLAVLASLSSGSPQSMNRYVLAAPSIFIFLSHLGQKEAFDRAWTLASALLMGLLATLFTFGWWVG